MTHPAPDDDPDIIANAAELYPRREPVIVHLAKPVLGEIVKLTIASVLIVAATLFAAHFVMGR